MSILAPPRISTPVTAPQKKRWTVEEFHRLSEQGWFYNGHAALLNGEIFEMPGQNPPHSKGINLADYLLKAVFGAGLVVRVQQPLRLSLWTDPEPDIAVVAGSIRDFDSHPTSALLVVEVADSTLALDLGEKALLYAAGQIADYWVVDVNNRKLIVLRDPTVSSGFRYTSPLTLDAVSTITPLAAPQATIRVADLLP
jgi:Uma2 family endonuclease